MLFRSLDIFEDRGVFADYLNAIGIENTLQVLDKYSIRYVLYPQESPIAYFLKHNIGWKIDYQDGTTVFLERAGSGSAALLKGP